MNLSLGFEDATPDVNAAKRLDVALGPAGHVSPVQTLASRFEEAMQHNESPVRAQSPQSAAPPNFRLPDEAAGLDGIVRTLISTFDLGG